MRRIISDNFNEEKICGTEDSNFLNFSFYSNATGLRYWHLEQKYIYSGLYSAQRFFASEGRSPIAAFCLWRLRSEETWFEIIRKIQKA